MDGGTFHGFVRDPSGRYTTFAVPTASGTAPFHINDQGTVVGGYSTTAGHGFEGSPNGKFTTVDVPGAMDTILYGINNNGAPESSPSPAKANASSLTGAACRETFCEDQQTSRWSNG